MPHAPTQNQIGALQAGNANCVTGGPFGDASHNGTPDVVTVIARRSSTSIEHMLHLYRRGASTADINRAICNATEAEIYNAVFGHRV